jgi:nitroreductase
MTKPVQTQVPILDLIARRWSGRAFDTERPVPREAILAMAEAARWAPSSYNLQPWRFLIWERDRTPDSWQRAFATLSEGNRRWVAQAPLLISVWAHTLNARGENNRAALYDTGAAAENLCLQATALGLMTHQMGGFDGAQLQQAFEVPAAYIPVTLIAAGYPAPPQHLPNDLAERETAPRIRRPLGEVVFEAAWRLPLTP